MTLIRIRLLLLAISVCISMLASAQASSSGETIRDVDFANRSYPILREERVKRGPKTFTLRGGESPETREQAGMNLSHVTYVDVTGDGREDAIVRIGIHTGGSAMPNDVYIYAESASGPHLIWGFSTGDRADGGFRNAYGDAGNLVIELYGKSMVVDGDYFSGDDQNGACCPKHYTRTRYRWDGRRYRRIGAPETLVNIEGHGSPVDS